MIHKPTAPTSAQISPTCLLVFTNLAAPQNMHDQLPVASWSGTSHTPEQGDLVSVWQPSEAELLDAGSLKWTGMKAADGKPVLGAWVAEMDFGTAPAVRDALVRSIDAGLLGYPPPWASEASTAALVPFLDRRFGWTVKPGWVRPFSSVLAALHATIKNLTRPGSAVVVPTPAYMPFLTIPQTHGRELIEVPSLHSFAATSPEEAWSLDLVGIEAALASGAGLVILCNPWNPTGRVLSVRELRALNEVVSRYDALVFCDEIHSPLVYGDPSAFVSYASLGPSFSSHSVTAVAASKAWNVAGLTASQIIIPDNKLRATWDAASGWDHPSALGSVAAVAAYEAGEAWLAEVLSLIQTNLDLLGQALEGTAVDYTRPQGTYLTWLGFDRYLLEESPSKILRDQFHLGVNEGKTLGVGYEGWARVNAAMSPELWRQAVERLTEFIKTTPLR